MTYKPANAVVWAEIPVSDLDAAVTFYNTVFDYGLTVEEMGPNPVAMLPYEGGGTAGHLYPGTPAKDGSGPTVHMAVSDTVEATAERWKAAGGTQLSEPITIPFGRFAYMLDPDGNSIALFEAAKG